MVDLRVDETDLTIDNKTRTSGVRQPQRVC